MRIRLLLVVGLLVVAGAVVAQEIMLNPQYASRAAGVAENDLPGRVGLAKWAFKNAMFNETLAESQKINALSPGDLRAEYLARAARFYSGTDVGRFQADEPTVVDPTRPPVAGGGREANIITLTDEEVRDLFARYGTKGLNEYRGAINPIVVRTCGTANCHGNVETAGRLYLKAGNDLKTVAENFKALEIGRAHV